MVHRHHAPARAHPAAPEAAGWSSPRGRRRLTAQRAAEVKRSPLVHQVAAGSSAAAPAAAGPARAAAAACTPARTHGQPAAGGRSPGPTRRPPVIEAVAQVWPRGGAERLPATAGPPARPRAGAVGRMWIAAITGARRRGSARVRRVDAGGPQQSTVSARQAAIAHPQPSTTRGRWKWRHSARAGRRIAAQAAGSRAWRAGGAGQQGLKSAGGEVDRSKREGHGSISGDGVTRWRPSGSAPARPLALAGSACRAVDALDAGFVQVLVVLRGITPPTKTMMSSAPWSSARR